MKDVIKNHLDPSKSSEENEFLVKEYLQHLVLKSIDDGGFYKNIVFMGGTALRILHGLNRFSEDLDFSTTGKGFDEKLLQERIFFNLSKLNGFDVSVKTGGIKAVKSIDLKFRSLLYDLNLSPLKNRSIYIKIDIDSNPPVGGKSVISTESRFFFMTIRHYDLPSLFSGKLHAVFFRPYTKGRDLYDFAWFLGKGIYPNFVYFNNAVIQTQGKALGIEKDNFKEFLLENLKIIDFNKGKKDVERFLFDRSELKFLDPSLIEQTIISKYS